MTSEDPGVETTRTTEPVPGAQSSASGNGPRTRGRSGIGLKFLQSLVVVAFLIGGKIWIEHMKVGIELERVVYGFLQRRLEGPDQIAYCPVAVLDIAEVVKERVESNGQTNLVTPRSTLREMITALADVRVAAIGIDIDFSPEGGELIPGDTNFFQFCDALQREKQMPIRLGVYRTYKKREDEWLGDAHFADLGGFIGVQDVHGVRHLPRWVRCSEQGRPLASLSAGLALGATTEEQPLVQTNLPFWMVAVNESRVENIRREIQASQFLVNLSWLNALEMHRFATHEACGIKALKHHLVGRVVLIGNATYGSAPDVFAVPGFERPVPGVLLHGCGVATLLAKPLFELSFPARVIADIVLATSVVGAVSLLCYAYDRKDRKVKMESAHSFFTAVAIIFTIVGGYNLIQWSHLLWTDFVLVALALWLHSPAERSFGRILRGAKSALLRILFEFSQPSAKQTKSS